MLIPNLNYYSVLECCSFSFHRFSDTKQGYETYL
jgi:hypothetical protein